MFNFKDVVPAASPNFAYSVFKDLCASKSSLFAFCCSLNASFAFFRCSSIFRINSPTPPASSPAAAVNPVTSLWVSCSLSFNSFALLKISVNTSIPFFPFFISFSKFDTKPAPNTDKLPCVCSLYSFIFKPASFKASAPLSA